MLFDFVCLLLRMYPHVSLCVCAGMHAHTPHMSLNFWNLKNRVWLQSSERLHLENKLYDNSVLFWYCDWQSSNAAKQRGIKREKQRKGKIEVVSLYLSCPKLSHSAASGGFCQLAADFYISLPLSPPFHFSVWAFIHLWVWGLKWLGWTQWEQGADDKYIY